MQHGARNEESRLLSKESGSSRRSDSTQNRSVTRAYVIN